MSPTHQGITLFVPKRQFVPLDLSIQASKFIFGSLFLIDAKRLVVKQLDSEDVYVRLDDSSVFFDADAFLLYAYHATHPADANSIPALYSDIHRVANDALFLDLLLSKPTIHPVLKIWTFCQFYFQFKNSIPAGCCKCNEYLKGKEFCSVEFFDEFCELVPKNLFVALESLRSISSECPAVDGNDGEKVPQPNKRNVLITAALPYVNNLPHLGNIIGSVLSADAFARYCKLRGYQSLFICGTDEYGTATETKALEEGLSCSALCDKYFELQRQVYEWFNIGFDYFGRTTTPLQTEIAQDIFMKLHRNNVLLKEPVQQLHCETCNRFLADRYVEGTCPLCGFPDARGDQCDGCGKLINACDLINPKCKICRGSPIVKSSEHLFLDLAQLQPECEQFVRESSVQGKWTPNGVSITNAWLQEGLKPRCITRDLKWGTPVPLPEMQDKVFYVWFDAPIGYISITANYTKEWKQWWKNPLNVELFQFMGKDNVPFHSVVFPCSLLGTREDWTLVRHISTTEYLNFEGGKFSKSRGIGVFGNNVVDSKIPVSIWRYYLLSNRPESSDTCFQWDDFGAKTNAELLANLGNLANRALRFLSSKYQGTVPNPAKGLLLFDRAELLQKVNAQLVVYVESMEVTKIKAALKAALAISTIGNEFLSHHRLDNSLFQGNRDLCDAVVHETINLLYLLSSLFYPFIPDTTQALLQQLNAPLAAISSTYTGNLILPGHQIGTPFHLFTRIEPSQLQELKSKYGGTQQ